MHGHRTAERRSLEYHRLVAERLDEVLLAKARARVEGWIAEGGPVHPVYARRWRAVLDRSAPEIASILVTDDEDRATFARTPRSQVRCRHPKDGGSCAKSMIRGSSVASISRKKNLARNLEARIASADPGR